jgi:glycosyltransferase involved in cell wall biosynthesis
MVIDCEVSELTRAIEKLSEDPDLRESMGRRGRELMRQRYSWRAVGDSLEKLYRSIYDTSSTFELHGKPIDRTEP